MLLEGFKVISLVSGLPSLSVTKNGAAFNKASVIKMEYADKVLLMINEKDKLIAIQKCEDQTPNATPFYKEQKNVMVRWNNSDLLATLEKMMGWDVKRNGYKITGEFFSDECALIFDLKDATQMNEAEED